MRVTRTTPSDPAAERGAVAVILALCLTVLAGAGALAVDTAQAWTARRQLATGTDAAALAVARGLATAAGGCELAAPQLTKNAPAGRLAACTPTAGTATVAATRTVPFALADVLGTTAGTVHATTTAAYGVPAAASGLRPFALCDQVGPLAAWLATGPSPVSAAVTVPYTKESPDKCGANAPGNWGLQDFDGGANSTTDTRAWILDGYPGTIRLGAEVPGDTGGFSNALATELTALRDAGTVVIIPAFDRVQGTGATATFHVSGFVALRVLDFKVTGTQAQRWIKLAFLRRVTPGEVGGTARNLGVTVTQICGTDAAVCPGVLP